MKKSQPPTPNHHPTRPCYSLGPPVSWELGASSLTEPRLNSPLLYMCWGPHVSWCMLPGWWSNVWEILGVQVKTTGLLIGLSSSSASSSFSPVQPQGSAASIFCLGANICIWLFQLLAGSSAVRSCYVPFHERFIALVAVSGLGASPWAGSKFGPVVGPPLLLLVNTSL